MRRLVPYSLFESLASDDIDLLVGKYRSLPSSLPKDNVVLGPYRNLTVRVVEPKSLSLEMPEWNTYIGSHHWGKKTSYIPEEEIWISSGLDPKEFRRVLNHEIIEREMMRALEEEHGMDRQEAWTQAHFYVKELGF
jgi:hypothetical protein